MLNVAEVFTSKWLALDKVRDYVGDIMSKAVDGDNNPLFSPAQIAYMSNALDISKTEQLVPTSPFVEYQTNNGIVIPDTPSCIEIATRMHKDALGEDIDTTPETHVGRMIEQIGKFISSVLGVTAANIMQHDLNSATGAYLDAIASWFFTARKTGASTSRSLNLTALSQDESIELTPENAYFTDGDGVKYHISDAVTFSESKGWSAQCAFIAEKAGPLVINDTGLSWSSDIDGKFTIGSPSDTTGYDVESDDGFRERIKTTRARSVAFMESVYSAIFSISGVYDAYVGENVKADQQTVGSLPIPGHSIVAVISYDGTSDTRKAIAKALYENKAVGCGYTNLEAVYGALPEEEKARFPYLEDVETEEIPYTDPYFGTNYTVTINKPAIVEFGVEIEVSRNRCTGGDLEKEIRDAIKAWANGDVPYQEGLKIGQNVKAYEIGAAISAKVPDVQVDSVTLKKDGDESIKIEIPPYAVGAIDESDVEITIV